MRIEGRVWWRRWVVARVRIALTMEDVRGATSVVHETVTLNGSTSAASIDWEAQSRKQYENMRCATEAAGCLLFICSTR